MTRLGPIELRDHDWFESWQFETDVTSSPEDILNAPGSVKTISEGPPTLSADVVTRKAKGAVRGAELHELLGATRMQPFAIVTDGLGDDGYYVASGNTRREDVSSDGEDRSVRVDVDVTRVGTTKSLWTRIDTIVSEPAPGHTFGNALDAEIAIPAAAMKLQVVDAVPEPTERVRPTPVETRSTATGDLEMYDATEFAFEQPVFLFELPYDEHARSNVAVWDTRGYDDPYETGVFPDSDTGPRQWQYVFDTTHDFETESDAVLDNGLLRIHLSEPTDSAATGTLTAQRSDANADAWSAVDLPTYPEDLDTDWRPLDVDLVRITQPRIRAQIEFEAVEGANTGDVSALDVTLDRGAEDAQWWLPESETDPIPDDLETLLDPIASESVLDAGVSQTLIARKEVRR